MTTIIDLNTKQSTITEDNDGFRVERYAIVYGVTGDADQKLKNAIADAGLPSIGDAHPEISGITLQSKRGTVIDTSTVQVQLSYFFKQGQETGSSNATSSANATTTFEETKFDKDGNQLVTQYVASGLQVDRDSFTAEVERPRITFEFEYRSATFPKTDINTYLGKINSATWNGYAVETILCTAVNVDENESDYTVRFSFAYNPDTWVFNARTTYQPTGDHPTDVDSSLDKTNGTRPFDVYDTVSFAALGFTL